jgi:hypothetical protein
MHVCSRLIFVIFLSSIVIIIPFLLLVTTPPVLSSSSSHYSLLLDCYYQSPTYSLLHTCLMLIYFFFVHLFIVFLRISLYILHPSLEHFCCKKMSSEISESILDNHRLVNLFKMKFYMNSSIILFYFYLDKMIIKSDNCTCNKVLLIDVFNSGFYSNLLDRIRFIFNHTIMKIENTVTTTYCIHTAYFIMI